MQISHASAKLLTVNQFADKHIAFTRSSLRWIIFNATPKHASNGVLAGNGFAKALRRVGRRVLIDEAAFFRCVDEQNELIQQ